MDARVAADAASPHHCCHFFEDGDQSELTAVVAPVRQVILSAQVLSPSSSSPLPVLRFAGDGGGGVVAMLPMFSRQSRPEEREVEQNRKERMSVCLCVLQRTLPDQNKTAVDRVR